jgi:hypothetical protein
MPGSPSYHGRTHLPGGTDPIPGFGGAVDLAQGYYEAFWDLVSGSTATIDPHDQSGAMGGIVNADPGATPPRFDPLNYSGAALLQGGLSSDQGQMVLGNAAGIVIDASQMASITSLGIAPSWSTDPIGLGPYLPYNVRIGGGTIRQYSVDPDDPPSYAFDLFVEAASPFGHAFGTCRMTADGSLVTATNPIVWANDDVVTATWATFVWQWD